MFDIATYQQGTALSLAAKKSLLPFTIRQETQLKFAYQRPFFTIIKSMANQ